LPALGSFPGRTLTLSRLSAVFVWRVFWEPPESFAPCWRTVATFYPLGNCDSSRLETCLDYLTQFGAVSNRALLLSPFFALTDSARTLPEELVNSASSTLPCGRLLAHSTEMHPRTKSPLLRSRECYPAQMCCRKIQVIITLIKTTIIFRRVRIATLDLLTRISMVLFQNL
jgi:hypothetical protein